MDELFWDMALYDVVTGGKLGLFVEKPDGNEPEDEEPELNETPWDTTPWDSEDELDDDDGWDF